LSPVMKKEGLFIRGECFLRRLLISESVFMSGKRMAFRSPPPL